MIRKINFKSIAALISFFVAVPAYGHGYITGSRSKLCAEGVNTNCGAIIYEPQSVEGPDRFPETGPADGTIAAAGSPSWAPLNEQTPNRWGKIGMQPGPNTFQWHFTANHVSRDWRYFITKPDWNSAQPLSRSSFDLNPFCIYQGNNQRPPVDLFHQCSVPQRSGYHVILGVWDVGDTASSFYSVVDVQFNGDAPTNPYTDVGDISPSMQLSVNDMVRIRPFSADGELLNQSVAYVIASDTDGDPNIWPKLVAENLNAQQTEMIGGVQNQQGEIVAAFGKNDIFVASSSNIVRAEVDIELDETGTLPEISVAVAQTEFLNDQTMNLGFDVTTNQTLQVTAQLYFQNVAIGYEQAVVYPIRSFSITIDAPEVGGYDLVVTGENSDTQATTQKTFSITVSEPGPVDPGLPVYPDGIGSYESGNRVQGQNGSVYVCLIAGWCNIAPYYYAPGTGVAWASAWSLETSAPPTDPGDADYVYPNGRGSYTQGTIVANSSGNLYRCDIPGWCNSSSATYYAPGTGLASSSAWTAL